MVTPQFASLPVMLQDFPAMVDSHWLDKTPQYVRPMASGAPHLQPVQWVSVREGVATRVVSGGSPQC